MTPGSLYRTLRTLDVAAITVSCVVGSGIFQASTDIAGLLPVAPGGLGVWAATGALCVLGVMLLAPLATRRPDAGGLYSILAAQCGERVAFLYGWSAVLVVTAAVTAAIASMFARLVTSAAGIAEAAPVVALLAIGAAAAANALRMTLGRWIQLTFTLAKLSGVVLFAFAAARYGPGVIATFRAEPPADALMAILSAVVLAVWTFDGWTHAAFCGGESRSRDDVARGWRLGIAVVALCYVGVNHAVYAGIGRAAAAPPPRILTIVLSTLIAVAVAGSLHAVLLTGSRGIYAMARDGFLPPPVARIGRSGVPLMAVVLQAILAAVFLFVGGFYELLSVSVTANWLFYAIAVVVAHTVEPRPLATLTFCAGAAAVIGAAAVTHPWHAALSAMLIASGVPMLALRRRASHTRHAERMDRLRPAASPGRIGV